MEKDTPHESARKMQRATGVRDSNMCFSSLFFRFYSLGRSVKLQEHSQSNVWRVSPYSDQR